jgi:hypothetical protein
MEARTGGAREAARRAVASGITLAGCGNNRTADSAQPVDLEFTTEPATTTPYATSAPEPDPALRSVQPSGEEL